jgi:hypothetical protein
MMIPPEMQFSDQDIIRAAVKAASHAKSDGIDLKDIYLELLDCTAWSTGMILRLFDNKYYILSSPIY